LDRLCERVAVKLVYVVKKFPKYEEYVLPWIRDTT